MGELVKDSILTNSFDDLVLLRLVELTISAERSGRPIYPNLLAEPAFFRKHFQEWVHEALEERRALQEASEQDPFS